MKKYSMKAKTITRIADYIAKSKTGYLPANEPYTPDPKEFARLTWFLEKILIPHGIEQYTQEDLEKYITKFLEQRGHEIEQEFDPEINAEQNSSIYTIHSTKEEKQAEKAATQTLLSGQMPCPNCGQLDLQPSNPDNPLQFTCGQCGGNYEKKDLVKPKESSVDPLEGVFTFHPL